MQQFKLFSILMTPSPLSLVACTIISAAYIAYTGWSHVGDNPVIYDYIQGPNSASMYAWQGTEPVVEWFTRFFSSTAGYYVLLVATGIIIAMATFALIQALFLVFTGTTLFVQSAEIATKSMMIEMFSRLWLRSITLIGLVLFLGLTFGSLLPLIDVLIDGGASYLRAFDFRGFLPYILAFLVCFGTLHMHVVFMRLLLLRPRIFSELDSSS